MLPWREARTRLAAPDACEAFSPVAGEPLLVASLDGDVTEDEAAARALCALPAPSVALVGDANAPAARLWAPRFDVVVANAGELDAVALGIAHAPLAAATLAQLLRGFEARSIEEGLVAESLAYSTLQAGPEFAAWRASRPCPKSAAEASAPLRVDRDGDALLLRFARPAKRNAYSAALRDALVEALALARADASIARIVLSGDGPAFCSGGDLDEFGTTPDPTTAHAIRTTRSAARAIAALADRVEARVHGACVGAGVELAAFASRVVAKPDAWFALPELAMGLVPGAGGTVSLPRRIGRQRTAFLAYTGTRLDAARALAWGLVDAIE